MIVVMVIAAKGWDGFTETFGHSKFPVCVLLIMIGQLGSGCGQLISGGL